MDILLLNGPNLNMLGTREPEQYGTQTLDDIVNHLSQVATDSGFAFEHYQSNSELDLINKIHSASCHDIKYIIANFAAFTHTSIALRDAMLSVDIAFLEIHLTNIYKREEFRKHSYFSDIADGVISGFGTQGYELALQVAIKHIQSN